MIYSEYSFNKREIVVGILTYLFMDGVISFFFYRSIFAFISFLPGIYVYRIIYKERLIEKRKKMLSTEFSQTLRSVVSGINAGYSIENAFIEAERDLKMFYGEESLMALEINIIKTGLDINQNLEDLVSDLGARSQDEEIILFSDVFKCAKRNGGNISEVLSETAERIQERICIDNEISLLISEKVLELRIMEAVPFLILLYLDMTSRGYFDVLYVETKGRIVMTLCLAVYVGAVIIAEKMVKIKI